MTQEEYKAVKRPLQEAEELIPKIKSAQEWGKELNKRSDNDFRFYYDISEDTEEDMRRQKNILTELEAKFTALISKCIKLLIEQRKADSGALNSLYPCPSYYCAMSAYETLFKNQPKEERK